MVVEKNVGITERFCDNHYIRSRKMVRTEISLFMKNAPGELGKFASLLGEAGINMDALTIQDASAYVQEQPAITRCAKIRRNSR